MFSRLFNINNKKEHTKKESDDWKKDLDGFQSPPRLPKLEKGKIRLLVYKESLLKKTLMLDSDALVVIENEVPTCPKATKNKKSSSLPTPSLASPSKYKMAKPKGDIKMLGEMIFGSVPTVYKGSILKVHFIRSPPQLMMTKVFALRSRSAGVNFCDSEMSSCASLSKPVNVSTPSLLNESISSESQSPDESISNRSYSTPIGIQRPTTPNDHVSSSLQPKSLLVAPSWSASDLDTMSVSSLSLNTSVDSHNGSFRHRFLRSQRTSLGSHLWRSRSAQSEELRAVYKQQPKIGVGVIFNLWDNEEDNRAFQNFFFSHYTLFEAHLQTFRVKLEKSFYLRQKFLDTAVEALEAFKEDVLRLCYAPRIIDPLWLNITSSMESKQREASDHFMNCFLDIYNTCEKKESSYFLSNLLTAVLTHHLSWVNTVTASDKNSQKSNLDKYSSKTFDLLAKCHPYNPLWAQISDLYGCLGAPYKVARTVIVGKNVVLVRKLLHFLSYFIRCCEVKETPLRMEKGSSNGPRLSSSTWSEVMPDGSYNSQNIQSWFERSCNIVMSSANIPSSHESSTTSTDLDQFKDFKSYNFLDSLSEESEEKHDKGNVVNTSEHGKNPSTYGNLKSIVNPTKCYCSVLKSLKLPKMTADMKQDIKFFTNTSQKDIGKTGYPCCAICRTHDKGKYEEVCEQCKHELERVRREVDSVCLHCSDQNIKVDERTSKEYLWIPMEKKSGLLKLDRSKGVCQSKPSFVCYCCSPSTYGDLNVDVESVCENSADELSVTPRPRKASDPVYFLPLNTANSNTNFSNLRNSRSSHDSGTEMECSVSSTGIYDPSSDSFRTNSISSQEVGHDADSDYCSVENEQLTSTLTDTCMKQQYVQETVETIPDCESNPENARSQLSCSLETTNNKTTVENVYKYNVENLENTTIDNGNLLTLNTVDVVKSSSTSTLKSSTVMSNSDSLDTFTEDSCCTYNKDDGEMLTKDLKNLRLSHVTCPDSVVRQLRRTTSKHSSHQDSCSVGKSMFAGYTENYMSSFVLQGCRMLDKGKVVTELKNAVKYSVLDEELSDAVCIVADVDSFTCELWGISRRTDEDNLNTRETLTDQPVYAADLVSSLIESTKELCGLNMPANFCLLHIEEQLRDLYHKSRLFTEYSQCTDDQAMTSFLKNFGYHNNDTDLLRAIGDVFSVPVAEDASSLFH